MYPTTFISYLSILSFVGREVNFHLYPSTVLPPSYWRNLPFLRRNGKLDRTNRDWSKSAFRCHFVSRLSDSGLVREENMFCLRTVAANKIGTLEIPNKVALVWWFGREKLARFPFEKFVPFKLHDVSAIKSLFAVNFGKLNVLRNIWFKIEIQRICK